MKEQESSLLSDTPVIEKNELGQTIVKAGAKRAGTLAPPPRSPVNEEYNRVKEEYLTGNGWELVCRDDYGNGVWRDPLTAGGDRGVRTKVGELTKVGGGTDPLYQVVCPPPRWDRNTEQAIEIQRGRDESGKHEGELTPLERTDRQGLVITKMLGLQVAVAQDLEKLLRRGIPEQPANLRAELVLMRRAVLTAAERLKDLESAITEAA